LQILQAFKVKVIFGDIFDGYDFYFISCKYLKMSTDGSVGDMDLSALDDIEEVEGKLQYNLQKLQFKLICDSI